MRIIVFLLSIQLLHLKDELFKRKDRKTELDNQPNHFIWGSHHTSTNHYASLAYDYAQFFTLLHSFGRESHGIQIRLNLIKVRSIHLIEVRLNYYLRVKMSDSLSKNGKIFVRCQLFSKVTVNLLKSYQKYWLW